MAERIGAGSFFGGTGADEIVVETPGRAGVAPSGFGKPAPKLLFDPDSVTLLPDASLRLDLRSMVSDGGADL